jgi:cytochrome c oxidase subunit 2
MRVELKGDPMKTVLAMIALLLAAPLYAKDDKAKADVKRIGVPAPADAQSKDMEMTAKKYEFSPPEVEIPVNTLVRLHLKAIDREHGFEVKSFKDSCVKFKPEAPATVELYFDKAGAYEFNCCKFCGTGHGKMKGKLIVK